MAGQSFGDRIVAAQHTLVGSDMSKSVCKASTSEVMGPKKKHLAYILALTNEPNISIPELADCLVERSKQLKWVIVFKSLITTHHLMCFGNERFIQHLASRNSLYSLSNFLDKSGMQGYDMSNYIRRYAQYLNEKAIAYRAVAYDFTRIKRGKDGVLRTFDAEKLIKAMPILQKEIDCLLEFDASPNDLVNGVINAAFFLLFKDLIRLFACYNDGIINLLEKYFTMKKSQCKEALDLYKRFLTRMNKVSDMLKVAEQVGIDKGDIPDLTKAPNSLLDALEQHLAHLEGKKSEGSGALTANVSAFNSISTSLNKIDVTAQQFALNEEKSKLEAFKKQHVEELQKKNVNAEPTVAPPQQQTTTTTAATSASASSDLLEIFGGVSATPTPSSANNFGSAGNFSAFPQTNFPTSAQPAAANWSGPAQGNATDMFGFNQTTATSQPNLFANSPFNNNSENSGLASSGLLQPMVVGQDPSMQAQYMQQQQQLQAGGNQSLESSLASAMANLNAVGQKANQEFEPKTEKKLTGGSNFNPSIAPSHVTYNSVPNPMAAGVPPQPNMAMYGNNMMWNNMATPMQQPAYSMPYQQQQQQMRMLNPNNPFGSM